MEYDHDRALKLIFPNGVPENLQDNPELFIYLEKLGGYKLEQLKKEAARLEDENKTIVEQTQDLAISNYKTFIQTSECSRSIFKEFLQTEKRVDVLLDKLPDFTGECQNFLDAASEINANRRLNSITLKKHGQLLEILEIPQLMERCIKENQYEDALELAAHVQKMGQKHGNISIIKDIVTSVENSWHTMLVQLLAQLRTDLQLPKCLQVVGYVKRMQAFGLAELKLKFLQARDSWLTELLNSIPKQDAQQHLTKTIELTRINVFNIITQYKAIFPEEQVASSQNSSSIISSHGSNIFHVWLHTKIDNFLTTLEQDLQNVSSLDTVLGQCMYFGLSFSRVGADFRSLMVPIFVKVIMQNFVNRIVKVNRQFEYDLEKLTFINKLTPTLHSDRKNLSDIENESQNRQEDSFSPPETLLDFHPLAILCNGYLNALNELRLCAPISLVDDLTQTMQTSLIINSKNILSFYKQEQSAFMINERESFIKFCTYFAYDLLPYLQHCIHAIFPEQTLCNHLGINVLQLQSEGISYLRQKEILDPLKHLLPDRINVLMREQAKQQQQQQQQQLQHNESNEIVPDN